MPTHLPAARGWFITGCSTGFGRALAELLLERGERVAATARQVDALAPLVAAHGDRVLPLALDLADAASITGAMAKARDRLGRIDVLVNNAGQGQVGTIEDTSMATARAMMETNYFGPLAVIHAVLPGMIAHRAGQIVNIGSVAGQIGFPAIGHYCAAKFAMAGLTESLGAELAPLGIRVTLAELGPFATGFAGAMHIVPPSPHYDMAALSREAGNDRWGRGDDPRDGARALLVALDAEQPPRRIVLGEPGLAVTALHAARRTAEQERWLAVSRLAADTAPDR